MAQMQQGITEALFALREEKIADFSAKLIPGIEKEKVIGVRLPEIRKLAKSIDGTEQAEAFLRDLPHRYLEENHLHSFLIARTKDYQSCIMQIDRFLPFVDNWAVCDSLRPTCFKKHKSELIRDIRRWLQSDRLYTVRFAIGMLMCHFLDEDFHPEHLEWVVNIQSEEYYLNMMRAWYFATALAKQYESTLPLIEAQVLDVFTQNKTIQKACESFRVGEKEKKYIKSFKIK